MLYSLLKSSYIHIYTLKRFKILPMTFVLNKKQGNTLINHLALILNSLNSYFTYNFFNYRIKRRYYFKKPFHGQTFTVVF